MEWLMYEGSEVRGHYCKYHLPPFHTRSLKYELHLVYLLWYSKHGGWKYYWISRFTFTPTQGLFWPNDFALIPNTLQITDGILPQNILRPSPTTSVIIHREKCLYYSFLRNLWPREWQFPRSLSLDVKIKGLCCVLRPWICLLVTGLRQIYVFLYSFLYTFDVPFNLHTAVISINGTVTCNKSFKSDMKQVVMQCFNIIYLGSASTVLYCPLDLTFKTEIKGLKLNFSLSLLCLLH